MASITPTPSLTHNFATAADGTKLSYYSIGSGPGIVVVHGAMCYALSHKDLALALSPYFTVHIISRRTRGLSGPYPDPITNCPNRACSKSTPADQSTMRIAHRDIPRTYTPSHSSAVLETEVSDLHTLLTATGSHFIISVSSGALITLSYHLTYHSPASTAEPGLLTKTILFEPAAQFSDLDKPVSQLKYAHGLARYEEARAAGDIISALVSALKVTQMIPPWIPDFVGKWMLKRKVVTEKAKAGKIKGEGQAGKEEGGKEDEGVTNPLELADCLQYDFCVGEAMVGDSERFKGIQGVEVLLMGGTESQGFLEESLNALEMLIEGSKRVVIKGIGHDGLCQRERGGKPEFAVDEIRGFFGE
ncbi:Alpha/Beta hydrolase protein [Cercophora newfieldiana]|uniref:Alpha/Beta hydrolase protein n=1 Tax=Cercophora newfieldiana TaxID=92897 RepID=A0AA39YNI5_9PEZI|nr:Alpha/Beta hydrolase protein [Cercophora newfieldiana]